MKKSRPENPGLSTQHSVPSPGSPVSGFRQTGFTLIELVVVITLVVVLGATLLNRVTFYQERAEQVAMAEVAGALQSALLLQYGRLVTHGAEAKVSTLAVANPMDWLARKPRNYTGEFYDPAPSSITPGNWVFDLKARGLIYVPDLAEHFVPGKDGKKWIRYRVSLMYDPAPITHGQPAQELVGALFEPVEPYRWFSDDGEKI